ncbi:MAG: AAA family ATPase [Kiritimatiellales bacterium]|nr:AAA family ATPase [Kiritimatiellales bacterium]
MHLLGGEDNLFLTGAAGTGKSFLLRQFLRSKPKRAYPVLASTGTAALLVDGRTFHSFFGLGILEGGKDATVARVLHKGRSIKRIREAECIVIDEVSMLSGETLAAAEEISRHAREDNSPWGGLRIVVVGDFAQLPPVQSNDYQQRDWAFCHPVWEASNFQSIYLQTPVRTTESDLLSVLNNVRSGIVSEEVHMFLDRRSYPGDDHFDGTRLFPRRNAADAYNHSRLETIANKLHEFPTEYAGNSYGIEQLKKQSPIPEVLSIKVGALVMLRKNDMSFPYKYVNGSLGTITGITDDQINIHLLKGNSITLEPQTFSLLDGNGKERASAVNFPISLAWATTIHKAQGASIDRLLVNISNLWESGHAYVALSRATSEEGLFIENWEPQSIFIDPLVQEFYKYVQEEWQRISVAIPDTAPEILPMNITKQKKSKKIPNYKQTESYLKQKLSLEDIAKILGWKETTILGHIEKLLLEEAEDPDIHYLRPPADIFDAISNAFNEHGTEYLKPVYDELNGEHSYDQLRLVRLFLL